MLKKMHHNSLKTKYQKALQVHGQTFRVTVRGLLAVHFGRWTTEKNQNDLLTGRQIN